MPLVSLPTLLSNAAQEHYAVGYFEAWDSYSLEAVVEAAEAERAPVILGFGCMMAAQSWLDAGGLQILGALGRTIAERTRAPVSLILNEAQTYAQALGAIELGFNTVMLDTSDWSWQESVEAVARLTQQAHAHGVAVEAELGHLPDAVGDRIEDSAASLTDPDQAARFVELTGIDCLAVSIGNVHLLTKGRAAVDLDLLARIHRRVPIPLVIHGGSGFPPEAVSTAIANGVAKFNVGTVLKQSFLSGVRDAVDACPEKVDVHALMGSHKETDLQSAGKMRMYLKVRELIRLYGSSGRAAGEWA